MNDSDILTNTDEVVQDAEVVTPVSDGTSVLLNLEKLIKSHISRIDSLKIDAKKQKEMLDDIFGNEDTYKQHEKSAKEAARVKQLTKSQILRRPNVALIAEKVKTMRQEAKDLETALSDYLREYERLSGSNEVEGEDGEMREIIYIAKLIKKPSRKK